MENFGVYKAINAVQDDLAKIGISKDKKNAQQGYSFRGIDDVYDALAPLLAKHKLCIIPYAQSRTVVERASKNGGVLFYVTVECEFHFISAEDGSCHIAKTYGEAMDSADKATNKAMSAAYKYAAFQTFCIPVDVEDADAETPQVSAPKKATPPLASTKNTPPPDKNPSQAPPEATNAISEAQGKRMFAISNAAKIPIPDFKRFLMHYYGFESSKDVTKDKYDDICETISSKEKFDVMMKDVPA